MRKSVFVLAALFVLGSCARLPEVRKPTLEDFRESVYQVQVELTLDLSPYEEYLKKQEEELRKRKEEERKKEEEARKSKKKRAAKKEPKDKERKADPIFSAQSTLRNDALRPTVQKNRKTIKVGWAGTGWVAARRNERSFVMTAGHVCESKSVYTVQFFDIDWERMEFVVRTLDLPIVEKKHTLVSREGVKVAADVIRDEDFKDESSFDGPDMCLLGAGVRLGAPLRLAWQDPTYGDNAEVVGAPRGLWGGGIAVASDVKYSGRGSIFKVDPVGLAFNGHVAPGNSGSAVIHEGRVVGLISLGSIRFPSLIHAVPHEILRDFLKRALPED